mmetsp:Transcript_130071/g.277835  ORF Transcript_130071/g.277835 Transcript_130071/m.277835 type:complete len:237 (-) Transcript_130071:242-952(-)
MLNSEPRSKAALSCILGKTPPHARATSRAPAAPRAKASRSGRTPWPLYPGRCTRYSIRTSRRIQATSLPAFPDCAAKLRCRSRSRWPRRCAPKAGIRSQPKRRRRAKLPSLATLPPASPRRPPRPQAGPRCRCHKCSWRGWPTPARQRCPLLPPHGLLPHGLSPHGPPPLLPPPLHRRHRPCRSSPAHLPSPWRGVGVSDVLAVPACAKASWRCCRSSPRRLSRVPMLPKARSICR